DSLAVQRQQQTRRAAGGQQPALEHSASSSLAQAEEEGHSRSSCEEVGVVAGNTSLPRKKQPPNPTGNNYESLLLLRGRKAADGAEISGTGDAHGLEYHRLHYSTVPHQQQHRAAQDPTRRSQKPTPPPLLAASY
uniref:Pecanex-like protein n=1 Tax=Macrostomum lignano TaxID=282301 RepID=A0A1I8J4W4_9PLAT